MLDVKGIVKKYKDIKASSGGADFVRLQDGTNRVRIVTFINEETGKEELYAEASTHFLGKGSQVCLKQVGERCPVCEYIEVLLKEDTKETKKIANAIRVKKRYYFNVVQDGELKILEVGAQACQGILSFVADEEWGIEVFDHKTGRDFKINKSGSGLDTEYDVKLAKDASSIKLPGKPKDLVNRIRTKSAEELEDLVKAEFDDATFPPADTDAGEEDDRPSKKKHKENAPVDELDGMSRAELKDVIEEEDLDVRVSKSMSDAEVAAAIREARGTDVDDDHKKAVDKDDEDDDRKKKPALFPDEDDLDDKDRSELKDIIEEEELEIAVKKTDSDDDIREGIRLMRKEKAKKKSAKDEESDDEGVEEMFSRKNKKKR